MDLRLITEKQKSIYERMATHVMQSWEWGEFRKSLGIPVLRYGLYKNGKLVSPFTLTLHKIPLVNQYVGYLPKGPFPDKNLAAALREIAREQNCAFIKLEPDVLLPTTNYQLPATFIPSPKPLFTKYNFVIDLTKSEKELLKNMHPKTRYNIKVAEKHGVKVEERVDEEAFKIYLKLYFETTKRQNYHGHNQSYHRQVWEILKDANMVRLLIAFYRSPASDIRLPITAWMLFNFKDTLYYPYGGSSKAHPEVMANNLVAWEAIKSGKKLGLKKFDMWGAARVADPPRSDPFFGFHNFKKGFGGELVEYIGTFDLVLNWPVYITFNLVDKLMPLKILLLKFLGQN